MSPHVGILVVLMSASGLLGLALVITVEQMKEAVNASAPAGQQIPVGSWSVTARFWPPEVVRLYRKWHPSGRLDNRAKFLDAALRVSLIALIWQIGIGRMAVAFLGIATIAGWWWQYRQGRTA